ncbi:SDR family oxidoreductase [Nocardia blacklockiae]|uniref:SDR family oxidoreductase n=1 Tax=Nocardia blacklockiae TaxID=480036 RepID=UPI001894BF4C|nr:NAD(P)H-binding protein [Nocardia blacklockiae]MBF6170370.1 NAD(P)H-binding protein [Nocardia blacklockiae]
MIVVTGATGNIGGTLVPALAEAGEKVVAVSRGDREVRLPEGVEHRRADLANIADLPPAFAGADALFLLLSGELGVTGPAPAEMVRAAADAGVRRLVFLSSLAVTTRPGRERLVEFEAAVRDSGLEWTILRPGGFFSNAFAWAASVRAERTVFAPFGDVALPHLDPADIAEVAAAALRSADHAGQTYTLTGPERLTPRDQARVLAAALAEPVRFVELTRDQAFAAMTEFMPDPVAEDTLSILGEPVPAETAISPDVERVLGRPARGFAEWADRNIAAFR